MRRFKRSPFMAAALTAAVTIVVVPGFASGAIEKAQDVFVRNTEANPVPTKAIGTALVDATGSTVKIGGKPPVDATGSTVKLDGTSPVDATGSTVKIDGKPPVDASGSTVRVDDAAPVRVEVTNQAQGGGAAPASEPWQEIYQVEVPQGYSYGEAFESMEPGESVEIEHVSVYSSASKVTDASVSELCDFTDGKSGFGGNAQLFPYDGPAGGLNRFAASTQLFITKGACFDIFVSVPAPVTQTSVAIVTVSGHRTVEAAGAATAARSSSATDSRIAKSKLDPAYRALRKR